jgi:hypothetical protein
VCTFSKECTRGFTSSGHVGQLHARDVLHRPALHLGAARERVLAGGAARSRHARRRSAPPSPPNSGKLRSGPGSALNRASCSGHGSASALRGEGPRVLRERQPQARRSPRVERTLARVHHPETPSERLGAERHAALGRHGEFFAQHAQHHVGYRHGGDGALVGAGALRQRQRRAAHGGGHEGHADHVGQLVALGVGRPVQRVVGEGLPPRCTQATRGATPARMRRAALTRSRVETVSARPSSSSERTLRAKRDELARHGGLDAHLARHDLGLDLGAGIVEVHATKRCRVEGLSSLARGGSRG